MLSPCPCFSMLHGFCYSVANGIRPSNPLRVLGEFLVQKSAEVEGAQAQGQSGKTPE